MIDAAIEPSLDLHRRLTQVTISSNLSTKKNEKNWDLFFLTLQDFIKSVEKVLNFEGQFGLKDFQPWLDIIEIYYFYLKVSYIFIDDLNRIGRHSSVCP